MSTIPPDVIDEIAAVPASLDAVRRRRPDVREYAQKSFESLFDPIDDVEFPSADRRLVAAFVTRLTADDDAAAFYARQARAAAPETAELVLAAAASTATSGPYGVYAEPGLQGENQEGFRLFADDLDARIDRRLAAGLEYAHLLTYRLRETDGGSHDRLIAAGWSLDGIVTLSQLIAFLAFQQRVAAGLRVLGAAVPA
jgi:CMD domain protein